MAQVNYDGGVPTVAPDVRAPDDTNPVRASAANFGGAIGASLEKAGEGLGELGKFYQGAAVDDQVNKVMTASDAIRYGRPGQTVPGPDGKPVPDMGFLGKQGADALQGWSGAQKSIDDTIAEARKNLTSPAQQLDFDTQTRRLRSAWNNEIGSHADQQSKAWFAEVNQAGATHAVNWIASHADNPTEMAHGASDLINFRMKDAEVKYGANLSPDVRTSVVASAKQEALAAQVSAIGVKEPARALQILDKNKNIAGVQYDNLSANLRARADQQTGIAEGQKALQGAAGAPAAATSSPDATWSKMLGTENATGDPAAVSSKGALGLPQIMPDTARRTADEIGRPDIARMSNADLHTYFATPEGSKVSIQLGRAYFDKQLKAFGGDQKAAVIAYNAGPEVAKDWQAQGRNDGMLPAETKGYLAKVMPGGALPGTTPIDHPAPGPGGPRANFANVQNMGDPRDPGWEQQNLTTVHGSNGQSWTVNKKAAAAFQGFLSDLEAEGYTPKSSGGYNYRTIRGSGQLSQHAFGTAIDIGAGENPMGYGPIKTDLPPNVSALAAKHGLVWGGDWQHRKDPMHFEWAGGADVSGGAPQSMEAGSPGETIPGTPSAPQVPGAPPPSMRANAYQTILNNPDLSPEARQHALTYINQTLAAQQIAADEDAKAKKAANDQSADGYVKRMLTGQTQGIVEDIANDQHLTWETRRALGDAALQNSGDDTEKLKREGGPGYWNAYKAIFAEPDDPSRIADATEIWKRAGPDGDLTLKGAKDLVSIMNASHKDPEQNAINTTKVGLLKYAQSVLTIDRAPRWEGEVVKPDLEGQRIFNAKFIPKFEAAYSDWVKKGKDPMDFLTQETVDKLAQGLRPKAQMDAAKMAADNAAAGIEAVPAVPGSINPALWSTIVTHPPANKDGVPIPMAAWSQALQMLVNSPTQATIDQFNASQFGRAGMDGATILQQLQPPPEVAPAGSAVAAPAQAAPVAAPPPEPAPTFHAPPAPRFPRTGVSAAPAPAVAPPAVTPPKAGHGGIEHPSHNPEPQKPANPQPVQPRTQGRTIGEILKDAVPVLPRKINPPRKPHAGEDVDPSKKTRK